MTRKTSPFTFLLFATISGCALISPSIVLANELKSVEKVAAQVYRGRTIVGWEERITLLPENVLLEAKFSPSSEGTVLHVEKLKTLKEQGQSWAMFEVANRLGGKIELKRKIIGKISYRMPSGKSIRRPIVKFGVCIAGVYSELDIALGNRSSYGHEIRIGRESLAGNFIIDPSLSHVSTPNCSKSEITKKETKSIVP